MKYKRVIPRDFFNNAKLLKCLGAFTLLVDEYAFTRKLISIEENDEPFNIALTENGELFCANYTWYLKGEPLFLFTPYNSKAAYPLFCRIENSDYNVLNEHGKFDIEFLNYIKELL